MSDAEHIKLLEAFLIDNPQLDELESRVAEFNIFEAMGAVRQELRHSDFLAFLLNPFEKHGLGDIFLKRFLMKALSLAEETIISPINIKIASLDNMIVERETQNIDILMYEPNQKLVCLVENKIFSDEHSNQLARYHRIARERFPDFQIIPVFLTPDGIPPQDENSPYIPFSYGDVADLIESLLLTNKSTLGTDIYTMIQHYMIMLRRHIVTDSDIAQLCREIYKSHKTAIDLIIEHKPDIRQDLSDYLATLVNAQANLTVFRHTKSYVDFVINDWKNVTQLNEGIGWAGSKFAIALEFSVAQNQLNFYMVIGPTKESLGYVREIIFQTAHTNPNIFTKCRPKLSPKWTFIYKKEILRRKDFQDATLDDLIEIIEPKWKKILENELPRINEKIMEIEYSN